MRRTLADAALLDGGHESEGQPPNGVADVEVLSGAQALRRPRRRSVAVAPLGLDSLMLAFAAIAAIAVAPLAGLPRLDPAWMFAFSLLVIALLAHFGHYRPCFSLHLLDDTRSIVGSTAVAAMGMAFITGAPPPSSPTPRRRGDSGVAVRRRPASSPGEAPFGSRRQRLPPPPRMAWTGTPTLVRRDRAASTMSSQERLHGRPAVWAAPGHVPRPRAARRSNGTARGFPVLRTREPGSN